MMEGIISQTFDGTLNRLTEPLIQETSTDDFEKMSFFSSSFLKLCYKIVIEMLFSLTWWDYGLIFFTIWFIIYAILPFIDWLKRQIMTICKPIMFSYQHVVITGGGTGLGKALAQGIFTRGAIVTLIGKDADKLE